MADCKRKTENIYPPFSSSTIGWDLWQRYSIDFNGEPVYYASHGWSGLCNEIYLEPGIYTYSEYVKSDTAETHILIAVNEWPGAPHEYAAATISGTSMRLKYLTTDYVRYELTFEVTAAGYVAPRIDKDENSNATIFVTSPQVNSGSTALPFGWQHSLRKLTTATDTITTFPADIYADGTNATVGLKGNMVQTGTPSTTTPIQPQETGERTGNLFNTADMIYGSWTGSSGGVSVANYAARTQNLPASSLVVSVNSDTIPYSYSIIWVDSNDTFIRRDHIGSKSQIPLPQTFSPPNDAVHFYMQISCGATQSDVMTKALLDGYKVMLNEGSSPLTYEPHGYKIPFSSANTTPVYLGEVETTRKVKKLVLTGDEDWNNLYGQSLFGAPYLLNNAPFIPGISAYSTHYKYNPVQSGLNNAMSNGEFALQKSGDAEDPESNFNLFFKNTDFISATDFKSYLQQQYTAGTPVTIWYVLATEETGIVNEPLRKIGDYADTLSGVSIPMVDGANVVDVLTTLKPSELQLEYRGWHPAVVHEKSGNLFDKSTVTHGYYISDTNGQMNTSSTYEQEANASDFIPISGDSVTIYSDPTGKWRWGAFYDSNKTYVSGITGYNRTLTIPENARYMRLTVVDEILDTLMVNAGSTALPYDPYWK